MPPTRIALMAKWRKISKPLTPTAPNGRVNPSGTLLHALRWLQYTSATAQLLRTESSLPLKPNNHPTIVRSCHLVLSHTQIKKASSKHTKILPLWHYSFSFVHVHRQYKQRLETTASTTPPRAATHSSQILADRFNCMAKTKRINFKFTTNATRLILVHVFYTEAELSKVLPKVRAFISNNIGSNSAILHSNNPKE